MLAHGFVRSNETGGENGQILRGRRNFFALELWKVVKGDDKFARTSTGYSCAFAILLLVTYWHCKS